MFAAARCGIVTLGLTIGLPMIVPAAAEPLSAKNPTELEKACKEKWQKTDAKTVGCLAKGTVFTCKIEGYKPFFKQECDGSDAVADPRKPRG